MMTLKSMIVGLALGYGALACGPDSVNNYYGKGQGNNGSGANGNYTCDDYAESMNACSGRFNSPMTETEMIQLTNNCQRNTYWSQECLNCLATGPCTSDSTNNNTHIKTPLVYCIEEGICQKD